MNSKIALIKSRGFLLQWHVTARCDNHCEHCYMYDSPTFRSEIKNPLDLKTSQKILDDFVQFSNRWKLKPRINFTGGDPLLRKDIFSLLEYAQSRGISIGLLGNPNHLTLSVVRKLKKIGLTNYQISLDGLAEIHDRFRGRGRFQLALKAIETLKKAGGLRVDVMFTLSRENQKDLLKVMELCAKKGVDIFAFSRLVPAGTGLQKKDSITGLKPLEYRALLLKSLRFYNKLKKKGFKMRLSKKDVLWKLLYKELGEANQHQALKIDPGKIYQKLGCGVGVNLLTILADGNVMACRRLPVVIGKVPEQSLSDIFFKAKELEKMRNLKKFKICKKCELKFFCRGNMCVAYGASGSYHAPDPQCWRFSNKEAS